MIRSDLDEQGYAGPAEEFRSYFAKRLERNGTGVSVNEPQDFGAIIRRRVFSRSDAGLPVAELCARWAEGATRAWREHVFDRLPGARQLPTMAARLERSYPFHPDLLDLVEHDWTQHAGFQRVRSTVEVFAATAYWWSEERGQGRWAPELIGVGDIPLHTAADEVLSSGLLHGSERQIVGMRQVAEKDITSADRTDGQAVLIDVRLTEGRGWVDVQPRPALRLATALWMYSVAVRAQGKRGANKSELLAALYVPDDRFGFGDAEEVWNALTDDEDERGLGALDTIQGSGGSNPHRYVLVTQLNKRMFQRNALNRTNPEHSYGLVWERVKALASKGSSFNKILFIERPDDQAETKVVFGEVDERRSNRLVVLDPRRWTLLNGRDSDTRLDIEALLGVGANPLSVAFPASCVVACVNTQRRDVMVKRARGAFAWRLAASETDPQLEMHAEMLDEARRALDQLDTEIRRSFQHYAYLVRENAVLRVDFVKFDQDTQTSLFGNDVWESLAGKGDAVLAASGLAGSYLHQLLDLSDRNYTLAEVVEKFWRDPVFPMIPSEAVARRAIFGALKPDEDGITWELVTATGDPLVVTSPEQLAINSSDHYVRLAQPAEAASDDSGVPESRRPGVVTPPPRPAPGTGGTGATGAAMTGAGAGDGPNPSAPVKYRIHQLILENLSLTNPDARERLFQLLSEFTDAFDPTSGKDIQVATVRAEVNAAAGALDDVQAKAEGAGARWEVHDEDF